MNKIHSGIAAASLLAMSSTALAISTQSPLSFTNPGGPPVSYNGYTDQEINTAVVHANKATGAKDITGIQEDLHHLINCLAGPNGAGFDVSMDNPCKRMGNGAVNDVPQDSDEHRLLTQALDEARDGLTLYDLDSAHTASKKALNDLENAANDVKQ